MKEIKNLCKIKVSLLKYVSINHRVVSFILNKGPTPSTVRYNTEYLLLMSLDIVLELFFMCLKLG